MFNILDIGASGLAAQRMRLDTVAANVANMNTLLDENGENIPYRRRFVVMSPKRADGRPGVKAKVQIDRSPFRELFDPGNRLADARGYVKYPNVDLAVEQVNAIEASRAYEANVTMMEVTKQMLNASLRLLA